MLAIVNMIHDKDTRSRREKAPNFKAKSPSLLHNNYFSLGYSKKKKKTGGRGELRIWNFQWH